MQPLSDLQRQFAKAILNPVATLPTWIIGPDRIPSTTRFGVYRNNVVICLIEALKESYPATCKIVGEEFFRAMARAFVSAHPPRSPVMLEYGGGFAEFIAHFEPAAELSYLPDVARIERAWLEAYHAEDADALMGSDFAKLDQALLPKVSLRLHPSVRFLHSEYPALSIWKMNVEDAVANVDLAIGGEETLICRPEFEVNVFPVPQGTFAFLLALQKGQCLDSAVKVAWEQYPEFEITIVLTGLMQNGAFAGWDLPDIHSDKDSENE